MNDGAGPPDPRPGAFAEPFAPEPAPAPAFADGPSPRRHDRRRLVLWAGLAALVLLVGTSVVLLRRDRDPDVVETALTGPSTTSTWLEPTTVPMPGTEPSTVPEETTVTTAAPDPTTTGPTAAPPTSGAPGAGGGGNGGGSGNGPAKARLGRARSWVFGLDVLDNRSDAQLAASLKGVDVIVLDGVGASANLVRLLQSQGSIVLGYLDVGAIEEGRPWFDQAKAYRTEYWPEWDEWFANVSDPGYRRLMTQTAAPPILAKGFDGLFLDVVDMVEQFPQHTAGMVQLVSELSGMARGRGGLLFMQNGDSVIDRFLPYIDGWNREDVSYTFDWDSNSYVPTSKQDRDYALATVRRLKALQLFVSTVDYLPSPSAPNAAQARATACANGAVPTVSDIGLTQLPPPTPC